MFYFTVLRDRVRARSLPYLLKLFKDLDSDKNGCLDSSEVKV